MICKNCKKNIVNDSKFCSYCGKPIVQKPEEIVYKCPNCSKEFDETKVFCNICGHKLVRHHEKLLSIPVIYHIQSAMDKVIAYSAGELTLFNDMIEYTVMVSSGNNTHNIGDVISYKPNTIKNFDPTLANQGQITIHLTYDKKIIFTCANIADAEDMVIKLQNIMAQTV